MTLRDVVIVGGSIAALTAAESLRMEEFTGRITVVSDEQVPPYTRVPLSKGVLAGTESLDDIGLSPMADEIDLRLGTRAISLDLDARLVHTTSGQVPFDGLVIATGGRPRRLGRPDQNENALRSYLDCSRLSDGLSTAKSVVIVGGGFLGMEIASTCSKLGRAVTVVDLAPPLDRLLGSVVAERVRSAAQAHGVRFVVAHGGVRLVGSPEPVGVVTMDGRSVEADLIISAVGDVPNVEWLVGSGVPLSGGVIVDERCRASPNIVAAGDVAVTATYDGGIVRSPHWTNAVDQARTAARTLLYGDETPPCRPSRYYWTEQFDLNVKVVGDINPAGAPAILDNASEGGVLLAWPDATKPSTIIAINHPTPPAKLKRMLTTEGCFST